MDAFNNFLQSASASYKFSVIQEGKEPFDYDCSIRFLFLEIGSPIKGIALLTNYGSAVGQDTKYNKNALMFNSNVDFSPSFTILSSSNQPIDAFHKLSINSSFSLNEMYKIVENVQIFAEEHVIATLPGNKFPKPVIARFSGDNFSLYEGDGAKYSIYISNMMNFLIPAIGQQPSFGLRDETTGKVQWISVPTFRDVERWCLYFLCKKYQMSIKPTISMIQIEDTPIEEVAPKVHTHGVKDEKKPKIVETSKPIKEERPTIVKRDNPIYEILQKKLSQSKISSIVRVQDPEPTLSIQPVFRENMDINNVFPQKSSINDNPPLINLVFDRVSKPRIKVTRYTTHDIPMPKIDFELGFDSNSIESLENVYRNANPYDTFILLMSIVKNGYNGNSIAHTYKLDGSYDDHITECFEVVLKYKESLLQFIISNFSSIAVDYSLTSMIRDQKTLKKFAEFKKEIQIHQTSPQTLPFQFSYKPIEEIRQWLHNTLYNFKRNNSNAKDSVYSLSLALLSVFNHYIAPNQTPEQFFKTVSSSVRGMSVWSDLKVNIPWTSAWIHIWLLAYQYNKLLQTFLEIFKNTQVIQNFYSKCSCVRNIETISYIATTISLFESLGIPINYETEKASDLQFIGKAILGFVKSF